MVALLKCRKREATRFARASLYLPTGDTKGWKLNGTLLVSFASQCARPVLSPSLKKKVESYLGLFYSQHYTIQIIFTENTVTILLHSRLDQL
jgi:hypothetical protein